MGEAYPISNAIPSDYRKKLGIYYTPDKLTQVVTRWAVRSSDEKILEPSFGGCSFITAALSQLSDFGATNPVDRVYGCDVDPAAFKYLSDALQAELPSQHFLPCDFLQTDAETWPMSGFDVVLGNPPYVSHHNMSIDQKNSAKEAVNSSGARLPGTASLWAYFVLHSMSFLRDGGRLAFVLPEAFLTSFYAKVIQNEITDHFASTLVIKKCFQPFKEVGAAERTIAVLAGGFSNAKVSGQIEVILADSMSEVEDAVIASKRVTGDRNGKRARHLILKTNLPQPYEEEIDKHLSTRAEDLLEIEIGLVTGANKYFVINEKTVIKWKLPRASLRPILARTADCGGLEFAIVDHQAARDSGRRCWLFCPKTLGRRGGAIRRYLGSVPKEIRRGTLWFKKREHWYSPEGYTSPNAFLTYMNHMGPRLILNTAGVDCTNTLHRINFKKCVSSTQRKLIALSLQTTFSQISAERVGRTYGGGVLKLEPSEFRNLRILIPPKLDAKTINKAFRRINNYLRLGDPDGARSTADEAVLGAVFGTNILPLALNELNATLAKIRSQRRS